MKLKLEAYHSDGLWHVHGELELGEQDLVYFTCANEEKTKAVADVVEQAKSFDRWEVDIERK